MRGKHAKQSKDKLIVKLKSSVSKLKTLFALEHKKRMELEHKLTKQSSLIDEIARLRKQNDIQVSDKYLKLEKRYDDLKDTVAGFKKREKTHERTMEILIGMYAQECGITPTEAMDVWMARIGGEKKVMIAWETPRGSGPLWGLMEKMRRKKFEIRRK